MPSGAPLLHGLDSMFTIRSFYGIVADALENWTLIPGTA